MKGNIINYNIQDSSGIISAEDGQRYTFTNSEWKDDKSPKANQKVDFEINDKEVKDIFVLSADSPSINTDEIKEKFENFKNSDNVQNLQSNIQNTMKNGIQNKFGFAVSIITVLAFFLPLMSIPFLGSVNMLDLSWTSKLSFLLLLITAGLFYTGAKRIFIKACLSVVGVILFFIFYDLFSGLIQGGDAINSFGGGRQNDVNLFGLLKIGTYIIIPSLIILLAAGFKMNYKEK